MAKLVLNPIYGRLDFIGMTSTEIGAYLKLDQTTPQRVINGSPHFDEGLTIKSGKKLIFEGN